MASRKNRTKSWTPVLRALATFRRSGSTQCRTVRVVAEASAGWLIVEGCQADGALGRFSVKARSLSPLQPSLI